MHKSQIENMQPEPQTIKELKDDELPSAQVLPNPLLCDALSLEGGKQLMGHSVEKWVNGKNGRFLSKGKIINYKKVKEKNGSLSIRGGRYLIEYSNGKCFWSRRCEFTITK